MIQPLLDPARAADLLSWVLDYVRREAMFAAGDRVLAAVSGGPDSVALLHLLYRLRADLQIALGVAHFDHGLRGEESLEEGRFVAGLARSLDLPYFSGQGLVREMAQREKLSLQMAARQLRLDFLKETCRSQGFTKLALGHTADDQVELFFLRLLRGAGPEGLKGMWPATAEGLVRPLLAVGKEAVRFWLEQEGLPYREDPSNLNRRFLRSRVRLDLVPELERSYNPRLKEAVWRTQALLQEEERFLSQETARLLNEVGRDRGPDFHSLNLPGLWKLDELFQKRLLREAVGKILGDRALTAAQVESLLDLARGEKSGGVTALGDCRVARAGSELHVFRRLPPPSGVITLLPPSGVVEAPDGWSWEIREGAGRPEVSQAPPPNVAWIDGEKVTPPLQARYFRPGDRFWPAGALGAKKLQDFLVNQKIPRWLRLYVPLVADARQILWVAGLRVAEPVKPTPASRRVLQLQLSPHTPPTRRLWEMLLACR
ncbi:MAG: tRNA lysidine(34) synthetase TilS [Deltaproteobacteria bacterium]|nr:tRNA lysidine(34) synthetase TilS [Deltaproteobacteria bacterium]